MRKNSQPLKIALISSEVAPFAKTGGLADVCGSLPPALAKLSHDVKVFTPYYRQTQKKDFGITLKKKDMKADESIGGAEFSLYSCSREGVDFYFIPRVMLDVGFKSK